MGKQNNSNQPNLLGGLPSSGGAAGGSGGTGGGTGGSGSGTAPPTGGGGLPPPNQPPPPPPGQNINVTLNLTAVTSAIQSVIDNIHNKIVNKQADDTFRFQNIVNDLNFKVGQSLVDSNKALQSVVQNNYDNIDKVIKNSQAALEKYIKESDKNKDEKTAEATKKVEQALKEQLNKLKDQLKENSDTFNTSLDQISTPLDGIFDFFTGSFGGNLVENIGNILEGILTFSREAQNFTIRLATGQYDSLDEADTALRNLIGESDLHRAIFLMIVGVPFVISAVTYGASPFIKNVDRLFEEAAQANRQGELDLISNYIKDQLSTSKFFEEMNKRGYPNNDILDMITARLNPPDPDTVRQLYLRDEINEEKHDDLLKANGLRQQDLRFYKELYNVIPPITDLIAMTVKEAFSPDIAEQFGQYDDFPETILEYTRKQGLTDDWVRRYWASHWGLPSPTQAFEMLHRRVIDQPTLNNLLRALDVMPYWREKLTQIAYNPLTRVDVRRMYGLGVLNREQVKDAYRDIGYNELNAERLTEFTVRYESQGNEDSQAQIKRLSFSTYMTAYKRGVLSRLDAYNALNSLGYQAGDINVLLTIADYEKAVDKSPSNKSDYSERAIKSTLDAYGRRAISKDAAFKFLVNQGFTDAQAFSELQFVDYTYDLKNKDDIQNEIAKGYSEGSLSPVDATHLLNNMGFTSDESARILTEIDRLKLIKVNRPSKAEFRTFYKLGIITKEVYTAELSNMGYPQKYIDMYLKLDESESEE